jgi:hypothetical protein
MRASRGIVPGPAMESQRVRVIPLLLTTLLLNVFAAISWGQPFETHDLRVNGAVITVIPADLRGLQRQDLVVVSSVGTFPEGVRWVSVFWQQEGGRFKPHPDLVWEMDPEATVIDVGSLGAEQGHKSIVYLTGSAVRAYHLTGTARPTPTTLLKLPTMTVSPEPSDLPRLRLIGDWKGAGQPWLGVPQFGRLMLYPIGPAGPHGSGEAVTFHQPSLLFGASREHRLLRDYSLQLIYRLPQFFVRDFNGDARPDLIAAWEDHLSVHLQDDAGRFSQEPSQTFHFNVRTEQESKRRSVFVSPLIDDLDGDGGADLVLSKMAGRLTDRRITTSVHLNRTASLSSRPDVRIEHEGFAATLLTQDLNRDGKRDLVVPLVRLGVKNIIRNLLSNRAEVSLLAHLYRESGVYNNAPDWTRNFTYQIDISDGIALQGVWPRVDGDFDGDGKADLLVAGDDEIVVYLAVPGAPFAPAPAARVAINTSPHLILADLTANRHTDIVMWYEGSPERKGVVRVLRNTAKGW